MSARHIRKLLVPAVAVAAMLLLPAAATAGPATEGLSAVDSIAADISVDGVNTSKPATQTSAGDSPTTNVYGSTTDSVPPPIDCSSSSSSSTSTSTSTGNPATKPPADTSSKPATDTCTPPVKTETPVTTTTPDIEMPVTGGGETPVVSEPVAGGGEPLPVPAEVVGGGGPELPFTGLPLWYAIYGGIALMLAGIVLWVRGRIAGKGA